MTRARRDDLLDLAERAQRGETAPLLGAHAYDPEVAATFRAAGVLALFTPSAAAAVDGVDLFLVQRSPLLRHHPGQIALPGGRIEEDDGGPVGAALRETHEETGIRPEAVEALGALPPVLVPFSRFVVTPVLGWSDAPGAADAVEPGEVLHTLRVPVDHLLEPENRAMVRIGGGASHGFRVPTGWVWGFTGNLLDHLFGLLGWTVDWDRRRAYDMTLDEAHGTNLVVPDED